MRRPRVTPHIDFRPVDALLEDGRFRFEVLSGSSAGALNAVLFARRLAP